MIRALRAGNVSKEYMMRAKPPSERIRSASMLAHLGTAVLACVGLSGCIFYLNPLCNDQVRNGDETGIDCGGSCGKCNIGDSCRVGNDCDESNCVNGKCT